MVWEDKGGGAKHSSFRLEKKSIKRTVESSPEVGAPATCPIRNRMESTGKRKIRSRRVVGRKLLGPNLEQERNKEMKAILGGGGKTGSIVYRVGSGRPVSLANVHGVKPQTGRETPSVVDAV